MEISSLKYIIIIFSTIYSTYLINYHYTNYDPRPPLVEQKPEMMNKLDPLKPTVDMIPDAKLTNVETLGISTLPLWLVVASWFEPEESLRRQRSKVVQELHDRYGTSKGLVIIKQAKDSEIKMMIDNVGPLKALLNEILEPTSKKEEEKKPLPTLEEFSSSVEEMIKEIKETEPKGFYIYVSSQLEEIKSRVDSALKRVSNSP